MSSTPDTNPGTPQEGLPQYEHMLDDATMAGLAAYLFQVLTEDGARLEQISEQLKSAQSHQ